jgi:hypothetical protein
MRIPSVLGNVNPPRPLAPVEVGLNSRKQWTHATDVAMVRNVDQKLSCSGIGRRIDDIELRNHPLLLLLPEDAGIGGHDHDLEALELQIHNEPICRSVLAGTPPYSYALSLVSASG